jgi:large subunit ribosomal protein L24
MNRIRKNDEVIVISGKDKGRRAKVAKVLSNEKLILEGVNLVKKHKKSNPQKGVQGGILEKEMPIHASNVMLYDATLGKGGRVGFKELEDGRKVRYFKLSKEIIDVVE